VTFGEGNVCTSGQATSSGNDLLNGIASKFNTPQAPESINSIELQRLRDRIPSLLSCDRVKAVNNAGIGTRDVISRAAVKKNTLAKMD
jgi:hypothetical protein